MSSSSRKWGGARNGAASSSPHVTLVELVTVGSAMGSGAQPRSNLLLCLTNYYTCSLLLSTLFIVLFVYMLPLTGIRDASSLRITALKPRRFQGNRTQTRPTSQPPSQPPSQPSSQPPSQPSSQPPSQPSSQPPSQPPSQPLPVSNATTPTMSVAARSIKTLARFQGGLGNHMFIYASVYGLTFTTKYTTEEEREIGELKFLYHPDCKVKLYFKLQSQLVQEYSEETWKKECANTVTEDVKDSVSYSSAILEYNKAHRLESRCFSGYLQSFKYFHPVQDQIRSLFTFTDAVAAAVDAEFSRINARFPAAASDVPIAYVGVHVRRGDYLQAHFRAYGYVVADAAYLARAMAYLTLRLAGRRLVFVVASQDQAWARANLDRGKYRVWFSEGHDAGEDMALLARCNHSLLTVGSYGWWSAYLKDPNTAVTVYMKENVAPGSKLEEILTAKDYYLPHWVPL